MKERRAMGRSKDIRELVESELRFDPLIDPVDITVMNVGGEVALSGTVPNYPQYLEAGAAARRIWGVRKVHNRIQVVVPQADRRDDAELTQAANAALEGDVTVPAGVKAIAKRAELTLRGIVRFGGQREAAAGAVAGLTGIRGIKNKIDVVTVADAFEVAARVQDALDRSSLMFDDSDVQVEAEDRTVSLIGHVRTWAEHDAVVDAAWRADGVYAVEDDLVVTG
jgi:osmotically-inducible protein OsmY